MEAEQLEHLIQSYEAHFQDGRGFDRITEARKFASDVLSESIQAGGALTKVVDEAVEKAIIRTSQAIVRGEADAENSHDVFDQLVDLLDRQPRLGVRTSTSVEQQAYSTPIPIGYLAATLAGIDENTTVYEPTA
ncbi:MAG: hypothetical protein AAGF01_25190, partial [Cyanobacteria bacterium P01_G01_bin.38]